MYFIGVISVLTLEIIDTAQIVLSSFDNEKPWCSSSLVFAFGSLLQFKPLLFIVQKRIPDYSWKQFWSNLPWTWMILLLLQHPLLFGFIKCWYKKFRLGVFQIGELFLVLAVSSVYITSVTLFIVVYWWKIRNRVKELRLLQETSVGVQYRLYVLLTSQAALPLTFNTMPCCLAFLSALIRVNLQGLSIICDYFINGSDHWPYLNYCSHLWLSPRSNKGECN